MYLLFRYHHIMPMQYYTMGAGEQLILRAFMHYQIEKQNKEIQELKSR